MMDLIYLFICHIIDRAEHDRSAVDPVDLRVTDVIVAVLKIRIHFHALSLRSSGILFL